jgi:hypothetical protein
MSETTQQPTIQVQIKHRWSGAVLFTAEIPADTESGLHTRAALEKATAARADLRGAYLSDADLSGADLRGADLSDADLRGADGEPLPRATPEQSIENLDKVRAIILDDTARLEMGHWHGDNDWRNRTCAEETLCGTTHCLAGWLQVCTTEPKLRTIDAQLAGTLAAPVASKMFFRGADEVLPWLEQRKYVEEVAEAERRAAERKAKRDGEAS